MEQARTYPGCTDKKAVGGIRSIEKNPLGSELDYVVTVMATRCGAAEMTSETKSMLLISTSVNGFSQEYLIKWVLKPIARVAGFEPLHTALASESFPPSGLTHQSRMFFP